MTCATSSNKSNGQSGAEPPPLLIQTKPHYFTMNTNTIRIFQILNILAAAIEFTYNLGKQSRPYILGAIVVAMIVGDCFIKGCQYVYKNRLLIIERANDYRNQFGSYFVYA